MCIHSAQKVTKLITPSFEAIDNLKAAIQVDVDPDQPFMLCPSHYHKLYRRFKLLPCAGCGLNPRRDHMKYKCIHKKFGTILYHKGSDLLVSLSWALGRMHDNSPCVPCDTPPNQIRNEDDHDRQLQVVSEASLKQLISSTGVFILKLQKWGGPITSPRCFWWI